MKVASTIDIIKFLSERENSFYYEDFTGVPNLFLLSKNSPINFINSNIFRKTFNDYHTIFNLQDKNTYCKENWKHTESYCYCCGNKIEESDPKKNCDHLIPITTMFCIVMPQYYSFNLFYIHEKCNKIKSDTSIVEFYEEVGSEKYTNMKLDIENLQITNVPAIISNHVQYFKDKDLLTEHFNHLKYLLKTTLQNNIIDKIDKLEFLSPTNSIKIFNYLCDTQETISNSYKNFSNKIKEILVSEEQLDIIKRPKKNKVFLNLEFKQLFWLYYPVQDFDTYQKYDDLKWHVEAEGEWKVLKTELDKLLNNINIDVNNYSKNIKIINNELTEAYNDYIRKNLNCNKKKQKSTNNITISSLKDEIIKLEKESKELHIDSNQINIINEKWENILLLQQPKLVDIKNKLINTLREEKETDINNFSSTLVNSILNLNLNIKLTEKIISTAIEYIVDDYFRIVITNENENEKKLVIQALLEINNDLNIKLNKQLRNTIIKIFPKRNKKISTMIIKNRILKMCWYVYLISNYETLDIENILDLDNQTYENIEYSLSKLSNKKCDLQKNKDVLKNKIKKSSDKYNKEQKDKKENMEKENIVIIYLYLINNLLVIENFDKFENNKNKKIDVLKEKLNKYKDEKEKQKEQIKLDRLIKEYNNVIKTHKKLIAEQIYVKHKFFSQHANLNIFHMNSKEFSFIIKEYLKDKFNK